MKQEKLIMDLTEVPFDTLNDAIKGMKLNFPIFSQKEIERLKAVKARKQNENRI